MSRHYYDDWRKTPPKRRSNSPYEKHRDRVRSRSPIRQSFTNSRDGFRKDSYEEGPRVKDNANLRERVSKAPLTEIDFEAERREIDMEMRRREEMELKRREEEEIKRDEERRRNAEIERIWELDRKERERKSETQSQRASEIALFENEISSVGEVDLRIMLEKNRTANQITPPPQPPNAGTMGLIAPQVATGNIAPSYLHDTNAPLSPNSDPSYQTVTIPGFDHSRLGSSPDRDDPHRPRLLSNEETQKTDDTRERLVANFTNDCDTVARVTQMLIDEDPSLEPALVKAMKGVLQKVMKKHLDGVSK